MPRDDRSTARFTPHFTRRFNREYRREEGRRQGVAELLARQLDLRFGPLDATDRARLAGADVERLLAWGERALTAPTLEEVFA